MTESTKRRAPAAERAVRILDCLSASPVPMGVSDLARALDAPKSSVYGICETLVDAGVLNVDVAGYGLGAHCLRWSGAYLSRSSIVSEFHRLMAKDRRLADYTITLSTLEGNEVVYLACQNSDKPLGFTFQIGMRLPAVYSATGKAMLSRLEGQERQAALALPWHPPFTARSVRGVDAFDAACETWRAQGYALDDGEIREGMVCLGAPILDARGRPVAGIALSMTSAEARPEVQRALGGIVRDLAERLGLVAG